MTCLRPYTSLSNETWPAFIEGLPIIRSNYSHTTVYKSIYNSFHIYVCTYTRPSINTCMFVVLCIEPWIFTNIHMYMSLCMCVNDCARVIICVCVYKNNVRSHLFFGVISNDLTWAQSPETAAFHPGMEEKGRDGWENNSLFLNHICSPCVPPSNIIPLSISSTPAYLLVPYLLLCTPAPQLKVPL